MRKSAAFRGLGALWIGCIATAGLAAATEDPAVPGAEAPVSPEDASYDVGITIGRQLYQNGLGEAARQDALIRGLREGLAGKVATDEQRAQANQFIKTGRDGVAERNQREAREFLEKNAKANGVRTTTSGLQYRVLAEGDPAGHAPGPSDEVTVQYRAALADGVEFDSSYAHGRPATLLMSSIIKGWREALLLMHPGARWQLFVPPGLAYGNSPPPAVPPGSLLVYDLELVRVESPDRRLERMHPAPPK
jgi:FKBP-type peptidyl-prolyl cis-trans isomerase FklB